LNFLEAELVVMTFKGWLVKNMKNVARARSNPSKVKATNSESISGSSTNPQEPCSLGSATLESIIYVAFLYIQPAWVFRKTIKVKNLFELSFLIIIFS